MSLFCNSISHRPCERVIISRFFKLIEKRSASDCYRAILTHSVIYRKYMLCKYFVLSKSVVNRKVKRYFKLTSPNQVHKYFEEITEDGHDVFS